MTIDETHDPARTSWVATAAGHSDFPVQNLPLGIFSTATDPQPRPGVAIGDEILDLRAALPLLPEVVGPALGASTLNALLALPAADRRALRRTLSGLLSDPAFAQLSSALVPQAEAALHLSCVIGDYTDFYVGIHHAENVGRLFRPDNPLLPNYKYVPIGYHGRASSIRPSGVPVVRPNGQLKRTDSPVPQFGPAERLDFELELGVWIGPGNDLGQPIPIAAAADHVAGFCLLNDWSARDLQAWEYQPLGPFLAKNFHSTISPWIVTAEALAPFRTAQPPRPAGDPAPLAYLFDAEDQRSGAFSIALEASLQTAAMRAAGLPPHRLSRSAAIAMYWTVAQIVTHHASNGCNLQPGDLLGTGTLSTADDDGLGSLLELTRGGATPIHLPGGETRTFVEDGDTVTLTATAHREGFVPIGFGECTATVGPAPQGA